MTSTCVLNIYLLTYLLTYLLYLHRTIHFCIVSCGRAEVYMQKWEINAAVAWEELCIHLT